MSEFFHATTLKNAIDIFSSKKFYLSGLYGSDDEGDPIGFFASPSNWAAATQTHLPADEEDQEIPPVLLRIYIRDDIVDKVIVDPVSLQRNVESYFVSIKRDAIRRDSGGHYLPIDGHTFFVDLYSPVNEKELLGEIEQHLLWRATKEQFGSDSDTGYESYYENDWESSEDDDLFEARRILEDPDYRKKVAQERFNESVERWLQLVASWNAYIEEVRPTQELVGYDVNVEEEFAPIRVTYNPLAEGDESEEKETIRTEESKEEPTGEVQREESAKEGYISHEEEFETDADRNKDGSVLRATRFRKTLRLLSSLVDSI